MASSSHQPTFILPEYIQQTTYGEFLLSRLNKALAKRSSTSGLALSSNPEDFDFNLQRLSKAGVLGSMPSRYIDYQNLSRLFGQYRSNEVGGSDGLSLSNDNKDQVGKDDADVEDEEDKVVEDVIRSSTDYSSSVRYNYAMMDIDYDNQEELDEDLDDNVERPSSSIFGDGNEDNDDEDEDVVVYDETSSELTRTSTRRRKRSRSRSSIFSHATSNSNIPLDLMKYYTLPYKLDTPKTPNSSAPVVTGYQLSQDGLTLTFPTNLKTNDVLLIKSNNLISYRTGLFYFETTILPHNHSTNPNEFISRHTNTPINLSIGCVSNSNENPLKMPGLQQRSFGFNSQDGSIIANQTTIRSFSSPFGIGDVIGCGIDFTNNLAFYTKNGVYLGVAFRDIIHDCFDSSSDQKEDINSGPVPVFGTKGNSVGGIKVNFGLNGEGFRYDIEGYLSKSKHQVLKKILSSDVNKIRAQKTDKNVDVVMKELVGEYFDHLGYVEVSKTFKNEVYNNEKITLKSEIDEEILKIRESIRNSLLKGEIDNVINLISDKFPNIFEKNLNLLFKLNCLKFLNFIKANNINEAIVYGQLLRTEYTDPEYQEHLNDISSLLAYPDPESSEFGHLLKTEELLNTLDFVNAEILKSLGKNDVSDLERLIRHDSALLEYLVHERVKESLVLKFDDFLE